MSLSQADLRAKLVAAGLNATLWQFPDDDFEECSFGFVMANWTAWLAARPKELVITVDMGGKPVLLPKWVPNAGDCDNLAFGTVCWADTGNALKAVLSGQARGGLAYGAMFYQAGPARPDNFGIAGAHAICWFVDFDGAVRYFEPGMGCEVFPSQIERASAYFGFAL